MRGATKRAAQGLLLAASLLAGTTASGPRKPASAPAAPIRLLDDFESSAPWTAVPASGVEMKLSTERGPHGNCLRVDFNFTKGGGYAVLHRKLNLDLPENYRFELNVKGATQPQNFEFKLIDSTGENVWWRNQVNFEYPASWTTERIRKRQVTFAWGPQPADHPAQVAALELAITAGSGGHGTVWFDDLALVPMPPDEPRPQFVATGSSAAPGHPAQRVLDGSHDSAWQSANGDRAPALTLDLGTSAEVTGLAIDWAPGLSAADYVVEADDGDERWRPAHEVHGSDGGRDWVLLPPTEARRLRIRALPRGLPAAVGITEVQVFDSDSHPTPESIVALMGQGRPRGDYPRGYLGEQSYWTVVGVDGDPDEGLLDEDGRVEVGKGQFSLEPFLASEDTLFTWADGRSEQSLAAGMLPIPTATRFVDSLSLSVTLFARGEPGNSELVACYRLRNLDMLPRDVSLLLALQPYQVNPPSQGLNLAGGAARIRSLERRGESRAGERRPLARHRARARRLRGDAIRRGRPGRAPAVEPGAPPRHARRCRRARLGPLPLAPEPCARRRS